MKKLGLVVRVSQVGGRNGERFQSPGDQIAAGTARAEHAGYGVEVFDADARSISGATPYDERPGMSAALRAIEEGRLAGIVVSALDRLVREDPEKGVTLKAIQRRIREARGVLLIADNAAAEILDPDDDELEGNEEWGVEAQNVANKLYRRETRKRWRKAKHNAWTRGVYVSSAPAGYVRDEDGRLQVNGSADAIRGAFAIRAKGGTFPAVARLLTDQKVPNRSGKAWLVASARKIISNPVYKGVVACPCGCGEKSRDSALALVGPTVWGKAQAGKGVRRGRGPGTGSSPLSGLLRCAGCGSLLQANSSTAGGKKYAFYRCQNTTGRCPAKALVSARIAEEYLILCALERLTRGGLVEEKVDLAPLEARVDGAEEELRAFTLSVPAVTPGFAEAVAEKARALSEAQDELENGRQRGGVTFVTPDEARAIFDTGNIDQRQTILREAFPGGAVVRKGRGLPVEEKIAVGGTRACAACGQEMLLGLMRCPECGMEVAS
jgi:DNA invertase Pin-like site-specific DNA recombinase